MAVQLRTTRDSVHYLAWVVSRLYERRSLMMAVDAGAMALASCAAYLLVTVEGFPPKHLLIEGRYVLFVVAFRLPFFALTGVYRSIWKYGSVSDAVRIVKGTAASTLVAGGVLASLHKISTLGPVLLVDSVLVLSAIMALRLAARYGARKPVDRSGVRALIVGAGDAGEIIARQMLLTPGCGYAPVGFLDDDPNKKGKTIHGIPVLGTCDDASEAAARVRAQTIIIAAPSASNPEMRSIVKRCSAAKLPIKTVPAIKDILDGNVTVGQIREVKVTDLIGRQPVSHDAELIRAHVRGKTILVTGAAGSIGSELCNMLLDYEPRTLITLDICENGLFYLRENLAKKAGTCRLIPVVANLQSGIAIDHVLQTHRPDTVFHAAAHKHVPLMEENPEEAVKNNVRGAINLILACERAATDKLVNISTDKAVNPTSIMGASKRLVEMFILDASRTSKTKLCTVRFGNVMGSSGSVIPLFKRQIAHGGPVTVTHPSITRYFMTISEAVSLVLQASAMGRGGEIFVLNMGEQLKIADIARQLIQLCGFEPSKDIEVVYTGLRPGEKMHEELWEPDEYPHPTAHPHILVAEPRRALPRDFQARLRLLLHYADRMDRNGMVDVLSHLLPRYTPQFHARTVRPARAQSRMRPQPRPVVSLQKLTRAAAIHADERHARAARRVALATAVGRRQ